MSKQQICDLIQKQKRPLTFYNIDKNSKRDLFCRNNFTLRQKQKDSKEFSLKRAIVRN
jgi:hypothetical protein